MNNSEWVDIKILADALGFKTETLRRGCASEKYVCRFKKSGKYKNYEIAISSLPSAYLKKYNNFVNKQNNCLQINSEEYSNAQEWQRKQADKYLELLSLTEGMTHTKIEQFVAVWNKNHPDKKVSYSSIYNAKVKFEKFGVAGLLSKKGQNNKHSNIPDDYYEYYKSLYLREGAPSAFFCWQATLGYAKDKDNVDILKFPSYKTFERLLKSRVPEQAIYMARFGNAAWNKKYASYIPRDYSNLRAGSCWVSDHAQIDVAVNFNGSVCFPWVTVFRDVKTSKWLGWFLHAEAPNSDHIFQAFYYGVQHFGLPDDIYLDNGKDYRCKDFAGGRTSSIKVEHNSMKENSLLKNIGINVHFALPYNAQTKPVERDFLKVKSFLSKGFVGYRGGKITERPEKLKDEIKADKIMQFEDFKVLFDDFIENFLNKKPSKGKVLQGKCPDELWAQEFTNKKVISKDDSKTDSNVLEPYSQRLAGVIAAKDIDKGYHWSPSNSSINGIVGVEKQLTSMINDPSSEVNTLNEAGVVTVFNSYGSGFRTWGNRSSAYPSSTHVTNFINIRRTADILHESVEYSMLQFIDFPIDDGLIDSINESVNAFIRTLIGRGALIDGKCSYNPDKNPVTEIANGHLVFDVEFMPPTPAERITFESFIDIELLKSLGG